MHDHTDGPLRREKGEVFPLVIPADVSLRDLLRTLAPRGSGSEVIVVWGNGDQEVLEKDMSLRDVRRHAVRLEIRKKRHVHWR